MAKLIQNSNAVQNDNVVSGDFQKADAWLNIYMVSPNGRRKQVGGIKLYRGTDLGDKFLNRGHIEGMKFELDLNVVGSAPKEDSLDEFFS